MQSPEATNTPPDTSTRLIGCMAALGILLLLPIVLALLFWAATLAVNNWTALHHALVGG